MNDNDDDVLNTEGAAEYVHVPVATLMKWRIQHRGPKYVKMPNGKVHYRKKWLDEFFNQHVVIPTPPPIGAGGRSRRRSN